MEIFFIDLFGRLALAGILGGLVGVERERHNRPAGLRTHVLVCVGSALVMIVSVFGFGGAAGVFADQSRIAAQVISGIGFLGAGTIMRQGSAIRGLTTAASLWVVAAIGLAVGIGLYAAAIATTSIVLLSLFILPRVENFLTRSCCQKLLWVRAVDQPGLLGQIGTVLGDFHINIVNIKLSEAEYLESYKADTISIDFQVKIPSDLKVNNLIQRLLGMPGILEVSWEGN